MNREEEAQGFLLRAPTGGEVTDHMIQQHASHPRRPFMGGMWEIQRGDNVWVGGLVPDGLPPMSPSRILQWSVDQDNESPFDPAGVTRATPLTSSGELIGGAKDITQAKRLKAAIQKRIPWVWVSIDCPKDAQDEWFVDTGMREEIVVVRYRKDTGLEVGRMGLVDPRPTNPVRVETLEQAVDLVEKLIPPPRNP